LRRRVLVKLPVTEPNSQSIAIRVTNPSLGSDFPTPAKVSGIRNDGRANPDQALRINGRIRLEHRLHVIDADASAPLSTTVVIVIILAIDVANDGWRLDLLGTFFRRVFFVRLAGVFRKG